ncbi:MAG: GNAT family N-acetyltransferase, partial [Gammaproteobacteria bacterium]
MRTLRCGAWSALGEHAARIRTEVFVREQGVPAELELDSNDRLCSHCVAYVDGEPVATGRLLPDGHAWLLLQFSGDTEDEAGDRAQRMLDDLRTDD